MVNRILLLYQLAGGSLLQHCCGVQQLHQAPRKKESIMQSISSVCLFTDLGSIWHPWVEVLQTQNSFLYARQSPCDSDVICVRC